VWFYVWNEMQMICIWSICCHCHPIISCFIKIQIGLTFLVPAYPGCPGKEAVRRLLFLSIGLLGLLITLAVSFQFLPT